jgi:hypothetical protein
MRLAHHLTGGPQDPCRNAACFNFPQRLANHTITLQRRKSTYFSMMGCVLRSVGQGDRELMGIVNRATSSASLSDVVVRGIFTRESREAAKTSYLCVTTTLPYSASDVRDGESIY